VFRASPNVDAIDAYNRLNRGIPRTVKLEHVVTAIDGGEWTPEVAARLGERYAEEIARRSDRVQPMPGVARFLRSAAYAFALCSSAPIDEVEDVLRRFALRDCFHVVRGHPSTKVEALRELKASSAQVVFVGDADADERAAADAGVLFVGFGSSTRFRTPLRIECFEDSAEVERTIDAAAVRAGRR
jgi:phosphoglycolate phosphatase-like HAD superfamily hydrolase